MAPLAYSLIWYTPVYWQVKIKCTCVWKPDTLRQCWWIHKLKTRVLYSDETLQLFCYSLLQKALGREVSARGKLKYLYHRVRSSWSHLTIISMGVETALMASSIPIAQWHIVWQSPKSGDRRGTKPPMVEQHWTVGPYRNIYLPACCALHEESFWPNDRCSTCAF